MVTSLLILVGLLVILSFALVVIIITSNDELWK